jgi:hypothetical protein
MPVFLGCWRYLIGLRRCCREKTPATSFLKMKISICVEKGNRKAEVPLTDREVRGVYDLLYICGDCKHCEHLLELNHISLGKLDDKLMHLVHDVIDEGKMYSEQKKGKKRVFKLDPERHYLVKKPKWQTIGMNRQPPAKTRFINH